MIDIKDLSYQEKSEIYQQLQKEFATGRIDKKLEEVNKKKKEYQRLKTKLKNKFGYSPWLDELIFFSFSDDECEVKAAHYTFSNIESLAYQKIILIDSRYLTTVRQLFKDCKEYESEKRKEADIIFDEIGKNKQNFLNTITQYK